MLRSLDRPYKVSMYSSRQGMSTKLLPFILKSSMGQPLELTETICMIHLMETSA